MFQKTKAIMKSIALSFVITIPFIRNSICAINTIRSASTINALGIYIHIPFCRRRCFYCDFPIKVIGDRESSRNIAGKTYTKTLLRDISHWTSIHNEKNRYIDSIYFGGGTPSLLPDTCIQEILDQIRNTFIVSPYAEVTFEMDPGTFDYHRLLRMREYGINRISIGVQSFNSDMLKNCGRVHTMKDVSQSLDDLYKANWENFSIDLISSLPHMTMDIWTDTLHQAIACNSQHVSIYDLQVEENTAFGRWYTPGSFPLPTEELSSNMYKTAVEIMKQVGGFEHYEVSNYARTSQYRSKHNQKYWKLQPVLGFGMSAASYINGQRFQRPCTMNEYNSYVDNLEQLLLSTNNKLINNNHNNNQDNNSYNINKINIEINDPLHPTVSSPMIPDILEVIMLSLRTSDGLNIFQFVDCFGEKAAKRLVKVLYPYLIQELVIMYDQQHRELSTDNILKYINYSDNNNKIDIDSNNNNKIDINSIRLTDPNGFMISNDIISTIFAEFS